jgi:hypothetical protein
MRIDTAMGDAQLALRPCKPTPWRNDRCLSRRTMLGHIPFITALEADDDGRLVTELRLARLRSQAAVVRTLADQVEYLSRAGDADGMGDQLIEEMAKLGCRLIEVAGSLARSQAPEDSGIFATRSVMTVRQSPDTAY